MPEPGIGAYLLSDILPPSPGKSLCEAFGIAAGAAVGAHISGPFTAAAFAVAGKYVGRIARNASFFFLGL